MQLGIDIGSVSVKVVLFKNGKLEKSIYRRFQGKPFETLVQILEEDFQPLHNTSIKLGLTGIGGKAIQKILGGTFYGEIASLAAGNFEYLPEVKTVIEMGGEDSKLLILDQQKKLVKDFAMNAQCAAGTGSFLDQQAGRLKISIENEFGQMALKSKNPPRIAGRCSVFAKSDMIHLQQIATPDYDIVAGLCFAVARNFKSSIARGMKFDLPISFQGGVAANPGMIRAFASILEISESELVVPEHYNVMSAIGAALLSDESEEVTLTPNKINDYLKYRQASKSDRVPLQFSFPDTKYYDITQANRPDSFEGLELCLGVDIGSLSTNLVLIDDENKVVARRYLMTEGRPIEAVRKGLREIEEEVGANVLIKAVGTTGSGRYLVGDLIGADVVRNEITAQATAAVEIDPTVDTIFEIGGQDSKYISIDKKAVIDFEMNKACAAGTGSFLQEQAEKLNIQIETEFADRALNSACPVGCGERCTVFMESDLVSHQRSGAEKDDLLAGLAYSIAGNYLTRVVADRRIGDHIFFQGGVAWNKAVVAAFEQLTGKKITVPPHHDITGAIGVAIVAREKLSEKQFKTAFKGFDFYKRDYSIESFTCEDCSNQCEIHQVIMEGENTLFYGARCEKYELDTRHKEDLPTDFSVIRQRYLYKKYKDVPEYRNRGTVGIPRVLHFYENYPFWRAFFESLGFKIVNSDLSNQAIVESSLKLFSAETCYPIKIVYGHIQNLIDKKPEYLFMPSLIKVAEKNEDFDSGAFICPYVQTISSTLKATFDFEKEDIKFVAPTISFSHNAEELIQNLKPMIKEFKLSDKEFKRSVKVGLDAYKEFRQSLINEGKKILSELKPDEKALVVVSRPYNGYDRKLSLELPDKIRNLKIKSIPLDFLEIEQSAEDFTYMYWRYGKRILQAAEYIRNHPNLFAVYITSFGCGPDSFITHFFRKAMIGKPYLQLELDEHSADAGMITRIEAFMDSLRFYQFKPQISKFTLSNDVFKPFEKKIYIPNMCDHAYPLRSAFERYGLTAEVLDEPDDVTLNYGKKHTSGKECFPCVLTTGDILKKINAPDFDAGKSVFFMPGATGPCRFGLYSQYHRMVLDDLGHRDIPIFSPNSKNGYKEFGLEKTDFRKVTWTGMVFVDCLIKLLHKTRPYEVVSGESEKKYYHYINRLNHAIINDESMVELGKEAARDFNSIKKTGSQKPVVGLVGEIYLRNNRYSNNHLIQKLEGLGAEVWLATFTEWPLYTSITYRRDSLRELYVKGILQSSAQIFVQKRQEHKIVAAFEKEYPVRHDLAVEKVLKLANGYLPLDCKGEAILSIGKAVEMAQAGAVGIINAMPFNCMPGTIVSSLSKKVSQDLHGIPWLNISYEGLHDSGEDTRLEAFTEQVKAFAGAKKSDTNFVRFDV